MTISVINKTTGNFIVQDPFYSTIVRAYQQDETVSKIGKYEVPIVGSEKDKEGNLKIFVEWDRCI